MKYLLLVTLAICGIGRAQITSTRDHLVDAKKHKWACALVFDCEDLACKKGGGTWISPLRSDGSRWNLDYTCYGDSSLPPSLARMNSPSCDGVVYAGAANSKSIMTFMEQCAAAGKKLRGPSVAISQEDEAELKQLGLFWGLSINAILVEPQPSADGYACYVDSKGFCRPYYPGTASIPDQNGTIVTPNFGNYILAESPQKGHDGGEL